MNWPLLSLHPHLPFLSLPAYSPSQPYSIPGTYQAASWFWIILSTRPLCLDRDVGQMPCKSVFPWSPDIMPKLSKHPSPAPPSSSHNSLSRGSAGLAKILINWEYLGWPVDSHFTRLSMNSAGHYRNGVIIYLYQNWSKQCSSNNIIDSVEKIITVVNIENLEFCSLFLEKVYFIPVLFFNWSEFL